MTTQRTWRWLALFLVVDLVLVVLMFRHVSGDSGDASPSTEPRPVESSGPADPVPATPAAAGLVEATEDVTVWGARGSCSAGSPVTLVRDSDGAREELDPGITELLRLDVNDTGDVYVIGAGADCQPVELLLSDGATEWVDPAGPIRRWHLTPGAATVTTPGGAVDPGCAPVSLVSEGAEGLVGCDDGSIRTSGDDGATWEGAVVLEGLRSVARTGEGVVALAPADDCAVGFYRVDGAEAVQSGCVRPEASDGLVLLAASGDGYVAVVGDELLRSSDGATWEPIPAP